MKTAGRNDPCHCGSGLKYKKCHLALDREQGGVVAPKQVERAPQPRSRRGMLVLSERERDRMRAAGKFNAQLMDEIRGMAVPGTKLDDINSFVDAYTRDHGHIPACVGYKGYPKALCTSLNEVICHGIPDAYVLKEGDIVNLDITSIVDGWHGDQSETFLIGEVSDTARKLVQCAFDSLHLAIAAIKPFSTVREIGAAIVKRAAEDGFSVVRDFQGHGIGRKFHQEPGIPHYPDSFHGGFVLKPGICFTIEPMINEGRPHSKIDRSDGWTARTIDGKLSAQFEHTLLMTEDGPEILTQTEHGPRPGHRF
ncbi:MAG: type I methionyl aminopeptidase [Planctomycetes bacterium]|nr:type I methionyl aminopeptidase [Planctomycetota bacterium]